MEEDNMQPNYHQRHANDELTHQAKATAKMNEDLLQEQLNVDQAKPIASVQRETLE